MAIFKVYTARTVYCVEGVVAETKAEAKRRVLETLYTDRMNLASYTPIDVGMPKITDIVEVPVL